MCTLLNGDAKKRACLTKPLRLLGSCTFELAPHLLSVCSGVLRWQMRVFWRELNAFCNRGRNTLRYP